MKKFTLAVFALLLPVATHAQYVAGGPTLFDLSALGTRFINMVPRILIAVAVIFFMVNLVKWLKDKGSDPSKAMDALKSAGYSLVVIFIMLAWMAILAFFSSTTQLGLGGELNNELIPSVTLEDPIN